MKRKSQLISIGEVGETMKEDVLKMRDEVRQNIRKDIESHGYSGGCLEELTDTMMGHCELERPVHCGYSVKIKLGKRPEVSNGQANSQRVR